MNFKYLLLKALLGVFFLIPSSWAADVEGGDADGDGDPDN